MTGNGNYSITIPPGKTSGTFNIEYDYAFGSRGREMKYPSSNTSTSGDDTYTYDIYVMLPE